MRSKQCDSSVTYKGTFYFTKKGGLTYFPTQEEKLAAADDALSKPRYVHSSPSKNEERIITIEDGVSTCADTLYPKNESTDVLRSCLEIVKRCQENDLPAPMDVQEDENLSLSQWGF